MIGESVQVNTIKMSDKKPFSVSGPLNEYRKKASFDWDKLRFSLDNEEILKLKAKIWSVMESDPLFLQPSLTPSPDEQHRLTMKRIRYLQAKNLISPKDFHNNVKVNALTSTLGQYDASLALIYPRELTAFLRAVNDFGTQRHKKYIQDCLNNKISGCVATEEICGSCRTTATYDQTSQEFELHSPDFESAKCWQPRLGISGTHAVVSANLITGDSVNHGVHYFLVPIRDPMTLMSYSGIIVGNVGEKTGQNGVDTGFLMFNKYRIPQENLLNSLADVSPSGRYTRTANAMTFDDVQTQLALHYLVTSANLSAALLAKAVTIAVRYSAVRKQFGPTPNQELPVIEYQLQQWRLFPYLASSFAFKIFADFLGQALDNQHPKDIIAAKELQQIASVGKYLVTSVTVDGTQECREACGGHGYLKVAGIGDIRNDNDGEHVSAHCSSTVLRQCSEWLLELWSKNKKGGLPFSSSALGSLAFIREHTDLMTKHFRAKSVNDTIVPEELLQTYRWLVCWLLQATEEKLRKQGRQLSECEVFCAAPLARAYIEHFILQKFVEKANSANNHSVKVVLRKLCSLYGVWSLEKHLPFLYQGGYMSDREPAHFIQEGLLQLCEQLKSEAISLVDALAPPDRLLSSVLGQSDGHVYRNMQASFFSNPQTFERPAWWKDVVFWQHSKL
ncbi:peroxisomal acyl-coenzyme A oxidase 3-like isoform X1 [Schistocerca piceifrons]|uniref:peroxisomal acyl-coenzyme A oxidase 3-like isoform X1 n=2 Tax=Schistocerca piceifrons TaxID=274613 RepID=UPI001F5F5F3C|nr:peroxisomal acyl-coenzyme A oxidase 3-like isoform X1 [Schistocerca piceifrons]